MKPNAILLIIPWMFIVQKPCAFRNSFSINYSNTAIASLGVGIYPFAIKDSASDEKIDGVFMEPSLGLAGASIFVGYGTIFLGAHLQFLGYEAGVILGRKYLFDYGFPKNSIYYGIGLKIDAGLIPIKIGYQIDESHKGMLGFEMGLGF